MPVEVEAYVMLLVLGVLGLARRPLAPIALIVALAWVLSTPMDYGHGVVGRWLGAPVQTHVLMIFFGGALLYALRDRVRLDWRLAAAAALLLWAKSDLSGPLRPFVAPITLPYLTAMLAYRTPSFLRRMTRHGDVSYGLYLWAFPVQQCVIYVAGASVAPGFVLLVASPIAYGLAWCSWRFVESPALSLKARLPAARGRGAMPSRRVIAGLVRKPALGEKQ